MNISTKRLTLPIVARVFAAIVAVAAEPAVPPTAVLIENVRISDGQSPRLSERSNVLIVGNTIQSISTRTITPPAGVQPVVPSEGQRFDRLFATQWGTWH